MESGQYQRSTRGRLPDWYLKRPHMLRGDDFYLRAYVRLSTDRRQNVGNRVGPIPWSAIDQYARGQRLSYQMREFFVDVMLMFDQVYREHVEQEQAQEGKKQERKSRKKRGHQSQPTVQRQRRNG